MIVTLVALHFLLVHTPDNQEITINAEEISSIRKPQDQAEEHFTKGTRCIIVMTNGKFIGTSETCIDIIKQIAEIAK